MINCELCGSPVKVKVVGRTTTHYKPIFDHEIALNVIMAAEELVDLDLIAMSDLLTPREKELIKAIDQWRASRKEPDES